MGILKFDIIDLIGDYDNFRQYWKENTEEDLHRDDVVKNHQHLHIKIQKLEKRDDALLVRYYTGRNNVKFLGSEEWTFTINDDQLYLSIDETSLQLQKTESCLRSDNGLFSFDGTNLSLSLTHRKEGHAQCNYEFLPCRYFSGFIEYALDDDHTAYHRLGDLVIHDQGGMAELEYRNECYTVELTQLVFAHKIFLMKVAIYDMPLSDVGINSKAISYAWTSPDTKRLGINIRKLISGWTYIEEGFLSSNNMGLDKSS